MSMRFGTAGVPLQAKDASTLSGLEALSSLRLGCMEMEFVQRVTMGEKMAGLIQQKAAALDISLSVHAPYYLNFNAHDPRILEASHKRLSAAARIGYLAGASDIVFHPGFYQGDSPQTTFAKVQRELTKLIEDLQAAGIHSRLRCETTGKHGQFGSLEETLQLVVETPGLSACFDFSHLHARNQYHAAADIQRDLERIGTVLGASALQDLHIHLSGMQYTAAGERNHLNLADSDFPYGAMLQALREVGASGRVVCESPNREGDALLLQDTWHQLEGAS
ncbi:MAG: TIM barrel protein [Coprothermobacterota bacterium]|nr:TIM barrel protein [Coprothermobacterota bacterium]